MKLMALSAVLVTVFTHVLQAQAYDGMQADYRDCTKGAGKVSNARIVSACSRLIDNATQKNELVGYFYALRASASADQEQSCRDAKIAGSLLKGADLQKQVRRLRAASCRNVSTATTRECMNVNGDSETAEGRLSIGQFQDAAGRQQSAYILVLAVASCLASNDPDERVESSSKIHVFASEDRIHKSIQRFVGKSVLVRGRPSPAHTVHHHAPIIMDIREIGAR
jgi:hypothetical protein